MLIGNNPETGALPVGLKAIHLYTLLFNSFTGVKSDIFLLLKLVDDKWITKEARGRGKKTNPKQSNPDSLTTWAQIYNYLNMMSCKARNLPREARVLAGIRKVMIDNEPNMSSHYRSIAERAKEILRCLNRELSIRKDTLPLYLAIMQLQLQSFIHFLEA